MLGSYFDVVTENVAGARSLIGVLDTKMHPVRGQTILVHAPYIHEFVADHTGTYLQLMCWVEMVTFTENSQVQWSVFVCHSSSGR